MLSVVKMLLKGEVGGRALNSHGNYIVDHGKSWENHGIVILNFCGNPVFDPKREDFVEEKYAHRLKKINNKRTFLGQNFFIS